MAAQNMVEPPQHHPSETGLRLEVPCPVLMLVYNGWEHVFTGLAAMQSLGQYLWLIDNGSTIDRVDEVIRAFPMVRIISTGANLGWAGGYNYAIDIARTEGFDTVYLINSDAVPREGAIDRAVKTLRASADVAAVGSMILHHHGARVLFDGDWDWNSSADGELLRRDIRETRTIHGAGFALKLKAFQEIGPFYEDYFLYHEEVDWCVRAKAAGWRLLADCRSRIDHEGEGSSSTLNRLYYIARNRFLAMRRGIALNGRLESVASVIEEEYLNAIKLTHAERTAITNGVLDGMLGRFGPRGRLHWTAITTPTTLALLFIVRVKRKVESILGRI